MGVALQSGRCQGPTFFKKIIEYAYRGRVDVIMCVCVCVCVELRFPCPQQIISPRGRLLSVLFERKLVTVNEINTRIYVDQVTINAYWRAKCAYNAFPRTRPITVRASGE